MHGEPPRYVFSVSSCKGAQPQSPKGSQISARGAAPGEGRLHDPSPVRAPDQRRTVLHFRAMAADRSVSPSQLEAVDQYVANQEAHHTRMTFQEELRIICRKNGIELDERFAWD